MEGFPGRNNNTVDDELRQQVLATNLGDILVMPPFVQNLVNSLEETQKVGHWKHAIRNRGLSCFPIDLADGFFFSCLAQPNGHVQVQVHDGNHRLIALHQEMPGLSIKDLKGRIKFIHCGPLSEVDIQQLGQRDHTIHGRAEVIYWFPPNEGESRVIREDPGHHYERITVHEIRCLLPPSFMQRFRYVVTVRGVPNIADEFVTPRPSGVNGIVPVPHDDLAGEGWIVAGDFNRWGYYQPVHVPRLAAEVSIPNLRPGESYRYKFFQPHTRRWFPDREDKLLVQAPAP